jgi:hypothetical protein
MNDAIVAGDSLNFLTSTPGYSAADGWTLKFRLVPVLPSSAVISITTVADGADHRTTLAAATTAGWTAGTYSWASWVEKGAEEYTVQTGQVVVKPNPRTVAAGTDLRSLPRKTLDDLMAARAQWASTQGRTRRYKIGDREREFNTAAELDAEIRFWQGQLANELAAERLAAGLRPRNKILTRFVRPR